MKKRRAYGGIVCDEFGYVLLLAPKDAFGGYVWTFPKGAPKPGESPQQTALRKVLEETGVEATIDESIPGVYEGDTSTTSFFLMSRLRDTGRFDAHATEDIRWVRFSGAPSLLRQTENQTGRNRDLAVFGAALQIRKELAHRGVLKLQVPPPPPGLEGICTCSLPLPAYCPAIEVAESCVGVECAIAHEQGCADHDSLDEADLRLVEATDILVKRLVAGPDANGIATYVRELYVRDNYPGSSLPKAVIFAIYKATQHLGSVGNAPELTEMGAAIFHGQETERWPGEGRARGPTFSQMFEVYSKRYEDLGP